MSDPVQRPPDSSIVLNRWGEIYLSSLKKNDPDQYRELVASGELDAAVKNAQEMAQAEYQQTLNALLEKEGPLKRSKNRQAQVARLQRQAEEVVREFVVVPNPEWAKQRQEGYTDENTAHWSEEPLLPKPPSGTPPTTPSQPKT